VKKTEGHGREGRRTRQPKPAHPAAKRAARGANTNTNTNTPHYASAAAAKPHVRRRVRSLDQLMKIFIARQALTPLEARVFDVILDERGHTLRQMAELLRLNIRRTHAALDALEARGFIVCPMDGRGRRAAYLVND